MASDRIFNPSGRRHHRPRYSSREWRVGLFVLAALALLVGWVLHRGAHPDPALFALPDSLVATAGEQAKTAAAKLAAVEAERAAANVRPATAGGEPGWALGAEAAGGAPAGAGGAVGAAAALAASGSAASSWAPFPADVAAGDWSVAGGVETYGADNAYVKIDGRDEFYKAFGLRSLACLALAGPGGDGAIDLELFQLGSTADAAGALLAEAGERAAEVAEAGGALRRLAANAGFLARGDRYLRVLGEDESPATRREVARLLDCVGRSLPASELPWAFALFGLRLGVPAGRVAYQGEDAFSFAFAREVYSAPYAEGGGEWFVTRGDAFPGGAPALAQQFADGFASYGEREAPLALPGGAVASLVRDRYQNLLTAVAAAPPFVAGVRMARDRAEAESQLARLLSQLDGLDLPAAALAAPATPAAAAAAGAAAGVAGTPGAASRRSGEEDLQ